VFSFLAPLQEGTAVTVVLRSRSVRDFGVAAEAVWPKVLVGTGVTKVKEAVKEVE
jgi:hypothetical protein